MKLTKKLLFIGIIIINIDAVAQVGIGTTTPDPSAQLDVHSTSKGFLPPRMTQEQRDAILKPVPGLIIWCNNCVAPTGELQVFNGSNWTNMSGGTTPSGTVTICNQVWMAKNLDVATFRNGDPIKQIKNDAEWGSTYTTQTPAYCYYNNDSATYAATYGKLYNTFAIMDPRGLAPEGWHIATPDEWVKLGVDCLGGEMQITGGGYGPISIAGGKMKEAGTAHWVSPNTGATNSSGFTALPGGIRWKGNGRFEDIGVKGWFCPGGDTAYWLDSNSDTISFGWDLGWENGYSVRCVKD
jgi:uncharacterized protein (TIGR02145 family)